MIAANRLRQYREPRSLRRFSVQQPSAFTLVELLVVVSIIALLIAILLPSLKKARTQAKNAVCMSNLHQIGLACAAYAAENRRNVYPDSESVGWSSFRVAPGLVWPRPPAKEEVYGLPAVFDQTGVMKASNNKVWLCPLNNYQLSPTELTLVQGRYKSERDYGMTYRYALGRATQNPLNYKPGNSAPFVTDNYNLRPFTSAAVNPKGHSGSDPESWQGDNSDSFRNATYWHKGTAGRRRVFDNDQPTTTGGGGGDETVYLGNGWGNNVLHYDLTAGFMALSPVQQPTN